MPNALALSPLRIGKLCRVESTDPTDHGTHSFWPVPSPLSLSNWILRIQTHIKKLHTDDSDCFTAWQATCRYSLRRGARTAGQDLTQSRVLRLQMVEITDSITSLRGQENMAIFWLVTHREMLTHCFVSLSCSLVILIKEHTWAGRMFSNPFNGITCKWNNCLKQPILYN